MALATKPDTKPFTPYGQTKEALQCREDEVLLSGPTGTGKTRAWLEKVYAIAHKYAGSRIALVRKTKVSLAQSVLVTWEEDVVPRGDPCLRGATREHRTTYRFSNGSEVWCGGMYNPDRIMSTQFDIIVYFEAIESTEADLDSLTTRLRNHKVPYQQLLMDCNPQSPRHHLYQRVQSKRTRMFSTSHQDNPRMYDPVTGAITAYGTDYMRKLEKLTGIRRKRYLEGRWVQSEGVIYDAWDTKVHLITRTWLEKTYPNWRTWDRVWGFDFGFHDPFVWQEWLIGPDNLLILNRELYRVERTVRQNAADILEACGYKMLFNSDGRPLRRVEVRNNPDPLPRILLRDHDAEGGATLEECLGLPTKAANKTVAVTDGIEKVKERLKPTSNGVSDRPRLYVCEDSLIHEPDPVLLDPSKKLPTYTAAEFDSYIWDKNRAGGEKDVPVDADNHGMDTMRYVVVHFDGGKKKKKWGVA